VRRIRPTRLVLAAALALVGLVWLGQGVGIIGGSFMSGDPLWAVVGGGLLALGGLVVVAERRRT
jgi:hypothetical protein